MTLMFLEDVEKKRLDKISKALSGDCVLKEKFDGVFANL